jgi:hypothetical protein
VRNNSEVLLRDSGENAALKADHAANEGIDQHE